MGFNSGFKGLTEVGHEYVIWIEVVQKSVHWQAFVNMMLNL